MEIFITKFQDKQSTNKKQEKDERVSKRMEKKTYSEKKWK
jgi:hypothetical protein